MKKLRTITQAAREIKEKDKQSALSLTLLKGLVNDGIIPCVQAGKRKMVAMEDIEDYASGNSAKEKHKA